MISLRVDAADIQRMLDGTILSYGSGSVEKISRYWILLALSGIIATAGVATDSTATVIGAMIGSWRRQKTARQEPGCGG